MRTGRKELQNSQKSDGYPGPKEEPKKKDEQLSKALRANLLRRKAALSTTKKGGG